MSRLVAVLLVVVGLLVSSLAGGVAGFVVANANGSAASNGPESADGDGSDGAEGRDGAEGVAGSPGEPGPAGRPGASGTRGANGLAGPSGPSGGDGASGAPGTAGTPGPTGPTGPQGSPGVIPFARATVFDDGFNTFANGEAFPITEVTHPQSWAAFTATGANILENGIYRVSLVGFVAVDPEASSGVVTLRFDTAGFTDVITQSPPLDAGIAGSDLLGLSSFVECRSQRCTVTGQLDSSAPGAEVFPAPFPFSLVIEKIL